MLCSHVSLSEMGLMSDYNNMFCREIGKLFKIILKFSPYLELCSDLTKETV